jgi:hypothetical protein
VLPCQIITAVWCNCHFKININNWLHPSDAIIWPLTKSTNG